MPTPRRGETRERRRQEEAARETVATLPTLDPFAIDFDRGRWSPATRESYRISWTDFATWCHAAGTQALPAAPETIAAFLTARANRLHTSTLANRMAAIVGVHALYGHEVKVKATIIKDTLAEIRRVKGTAKTPKAALIADDIRAIMRQVPAERLRDRAILLLGFASAMRRSEIVALNWEDIEFGGDSATITIRRSKTDKAGKGQTIAILRTGGALCPVRALERWQREDGLPSDAMERATALAAPGVVRRGPVFPGDDSGHIGPRTVADAVKRWARAANIDPRTVAAHSLRRGCITTMFRLGGDLKSIMALSRHKSSEIALGYVQAETAQRNPAIKLLAL